MVDMSTCDDRSQEAHKLEEKSAFQRACDHKERFDKVTAETASVVRDVCEKYRDNPLVKSTDSDDEGQVELQSSSDKPKESSSKTDASKTSSKTSGTTAGGTSASSKCDEDFLAAAMKESGIDPATLPDPSVLFGEDGIGNMADLMKQLEETGLGTPEEFAEIVKDPTFHAMMTHFDNMMNQHLGPASKSNGSTENGAAATSEPDGSRMNSVADSTTAAKPDTTSSKVVAKVEEETKEDDLDNMSDDDLLGSLDAKPESKDAKKTTEGAGKGSKADTEAKKDDPDAWLKNISKAAQALNQPTNPKTMHNNWPGEMADVKLYEGAMQELKKMVQDDPQMADTFDKALSQFLGPDVLQEAVHNVTLHMTPWLEKNKATLKENDQKRYTKMLGLYSEIGGIFEELSLKPNETSSKRVDALMTELQTLGELPVEVMTEINNSGKNLNVPGAMGNFTSAMSNHGGSSSSTSSAKKDDDGDESMGKTGFNKTRINSPSAGPFSEKELASMRALLSGGIPGSNDLNDAEKAQFDALLKSSFEGQGGAFSELCESMTRDFQKRFSNPTPNTSNAQKEKDEKSASTDSKDGKTESKPSDTDNRKSPSKDVTKPDTDHDKFLQEALEANPFGNIEELQKMFTKEFGNDPEMQKLMFGENGMMGTFAKLEEEIASANKNAGKKEVRKFSPESADSKKTEAPEPPKQTDDISSIPEAWKPKDGEEKGKKETADCKMQ